MAYFDEYPQHFRAFIGMLSVLLFGMATYNVYRYASTTTDENWFDSSPSHLYVVKSFPAQRTNFKIAAAPRADQSFQPDSIRVGDLLLAINEQQVEALDSATKILRMLPADANFLLQVFRLQRNEKQTYRVAKAAVPDSFLRRIPTTAKVTTVFKDGASDRAGMQVGDLIFRINRQNFKNHLEADAVLRRGQSGKTLVYDIIRDNREISLQVKLARFGIAIPVILFSLCGLVYMASGVFIALQRPQMKAARLLGLAFLLIGYFFAVIFVQRDFFNTPFVIARFTTLVVSVCLGIAAWFHSDHYFPRERPELLAKPWVRHSFYGLALVVMMLAIFTQKALVLVSGVLLFLIYGLGVYWHFRKQRSAEYKKLRGVIRWAGHLAGILVLGLFLLINVVLRVNPQFANGYLGIPLLLIPLAYLYTIGRYHLLEMDLRVRRNVQYTIISLVWWLLVIKLAIMVFAFLPNIDWPLPNVHFTGGTIEILDEPLLPEQREPLEKGILMCIAIVLSVGFWKLGKSGQQRLDKKYHRTEYDYRRAANELADVMSTKLNMVDIARGIVLKLYQLMHLKRVGVLFFRNQKACCCREAYGFDEAGWEELCIAIDQKLLDVLKNFRSESRLSVDYLPNGLKQTLTEKGFRHIIQIRSKEKLVGAMLIGEKRSEIPFCQEDFDFLTAAAKQASVAVENSFLYEELAEQERLKHELEIARRIQLASLPQTTPKVDGLDIAGASIPATEVGGDYFDYLNGAPNAIRVIIGDVSGKGTSAALYMSKVQGIMRSLHGFGLSPKELFVRTNNLLCQDMERKSFVTSLGADFVSSTRHMILARAGHLPLFYYHAKTKRVEKITPKGLGLGLDNHGMFAAELEERAVQYDVGDVFLFVTDGVTEAQSNGHGEFGEESVVKILANNSSFSAMQIRDGVINAVKQFAGDHHQHDDLTVVVVKAV